MASPRLSARLLRDQLGSTALNHPLYGDLADRIRLLVVDGRLSQGIRMPSERALAGELGLSRTTIAAAYGALRSGGLLSARQGASHVVTLPSGPAPSQRTILDLGDDRVISLTMASGPAPVAVRSAFASAYEQLPELLAGSGYLPQGLPLLRNRLAAWFGARGLPTDPDQLIVTSGALSALTVVTRTLLDPGDRVLMESPTYPNAVATVRRSGGRPVAYPLPEDGWEMPGFEASVRQTAPRVAYLIPDFHNPTGLIMDADTRSAVGATLRRQRTVAVVDETLVELALDARTPPPPFAALGDAVTIGSASKAFWGGLRLGWIRAPHDLVRPMIEERAVLDVGAAAFEQVVLAELLASPAPALAEQRDGLRLQRNHLLAELAEHLPDWQVRTPGGGMSAWAKLPFEASSRLAALSDRYGVIITAGPRFFVSGGGERNIRLPFSSPTGVLTEAVRRLAAAWSDLVGGRRATRTDRLGLIA